MSRLSRELTIINELGLHARSAAMISKIAQTASGRVRIIRHGESVDAASVVDILTLACGKNATVTLQIDDPADIAVLDRIEELIKSGFGEE